ncbi:competence protein ComK [Ectobacillus sp. JY-23]|uniref:competence protein ComK n=1 Tax=Ectobacillus sp. JY-23 TaxID=2933872 RepID=UPI001FF18876|nr:competence protein ComK [Ectobacillus sp. JY-23]UOY92081.1 competence protein ComK [Ectobacillus sp. JY-23]
MARQERFEDEDLVRCADSYIINKDTIAVLPVTRVGKPTISMVIEEEQVIYILQEPVDIIKTSCRSYGSSLEGRIEGTRELIGTVNKAPIVIHDRLYYFPTTSYTREDCAWISHSHAAKSKPLSPKTLLLKFINGQTIKLPMSHQSFTNQLNRTAQLRSVYENSRERRKFPYLVVLEAEELLGNQKGKSTYLSDWKD